ncbi:flagellar hook protein FlgE [Gelria sp. Kuro-4]|uniref:flagellar hook protein FlgE n=1 Tax=Gelria sp. Kuro-4 TaxID=2796927 RepID=UPI001BEF086F|nr:flagellar hook protein FlgE [Gelria sp. Kuro-4]BCV24929.1 flagellar hook protein FlgE [Gelria sp. Kuro-4]
MMRSMYAAVSGLRNHQTRMDVIGNNIANVNTIGFKKSRVTFRDAFSQILRGASRPEGGQGGTNPMQVGLGMVLGSIDTIHTKGNTQTTGNMTDLAIDGAGYFILNSGSGSPVYTRAGAFRFDGEGNFVNPDGLKVQGWYLDEQGNRLAGPGGTVDPTADPTDLALIPALTKSPPKPTSSVKLSGNLDAGTAAGESFTRSFTVYDKLGNPYSVSVRFTPTTNANEWTWEIPNPASTTTPFVSGTLTFGADGTFSSVSVDASNGDKWSGTVNQSGSSVTLTFSPDGTIDNPPYSQDDCPQTFDFSGITQYADPRGESLINVTQDGYTKGDLEEITVDAGGVVSGSYSNGVSRPLLKVALATFTNPGGLISKGGSLFAVSNNSGAPEVSEPGSGQAGAIAPSSLEMSNVDLSEEFTDMIVTQRGFQANSRVITVSDEMLQELVNLKR